MKGFLLYLALISVAGAASAAADKAAAKRHAWRVPERTLFLIALCGGSAAMYITMRLIRHKTRHRRFMIGLPAIILVQLASAAVILYLCGGFPFG